MFKTATRSLFCVLFTAMAGLLIAGCHTIEGAGRDVEAVGGGVAETAEDTRPYEARQPR